MSETVWLVILLIMIVVFVTIAGIDAMDLFKKKDKK